jgi:hypothetical protein
LFAKNAADVTELKTGSQLCSKKRLNHPANAGFILIFTILAFSVIFYFLTALSQRLIILQTGFTSYASRIKAYYLALAGSARAISFIKYDPLWPPTDQPYQGPSNGLIPWLVNNPPSGSWGFKESLTEGSYKIVWEEGKDYFYSLGFLNNGGGNPLMITKTSFTKTPFQILKREEI